MAIAATQLLLKICKVEIDRVTAHKKTGGKAVVIYREKALMVIFRLFSKFSL